MGDLQTQAIGLLDDAAVHVDKIPGIAILIGVSLFAATVGDDVRHNYMLHYWVRLCLCWITWGATGQRAQQHCHRTDLNEYGCPVQNLPMLKL